MVKKFPRIGYTEFNSIVYLGLSKIDGINLSPYIDYQITKKKYISWNIYARGYINVYTCHSSGREYYNYRNLFKIKKIIEVW